MGIGGETELNMVAVVNATRTCGRFRRRDFVVVGGGAKRFNPVWGGVGNVAGDEFVGCETYRVDMDSGAAGIG